MRSARSPGGQSHRPQRDFRALAGPRTLLPSGERVLNRKQRQEGGEAARRLWRFSENLLGSFWGPHTPAPVAPPPLGLVRPAASAARLSPGLQVSVWAPPHPNPGPRLGLRALAVCLSFIPEISAVATSGDSARCFKRRSRLARSSAWTLPRLRHGVRFRLPRAASSRGEVEGAEELPLTPCGRDRAVGRSGLETRGPGVSSAVWRGPKSGLFFRSPPRSFTYPARALLWENRGRDLVSTSFPPHKAGRRDCALETRPGAQTLPPLHPSELPG